MLVRNTERSSVFFVYLLIILFNTSSCDVINLNDLADPVLYDFRQKIYEENLEKVRVSDIFEEFKVKLFGLNLRLLRFQCTNGWVSDLSSIRRAGDILMYPNGAGFEIEFPFGFDNFQFDCTSYILDAPIAKFDGQLNGRVGLNEFHLKVFVQFVDEKCTFKVVRFRVKRLEDIQVSVTGFSILNNFVNKIGTKVARSFHEAISNKIVNALKQSLIKKVEDAELCRQYASARR